MVAIKLILLVMFFLVQQILKTATTKVTMKPCLVTARGCVPVHPTVRQWKEPSEHTGAGPRDLKSAQTIFLGEKVECKKHMVVYWL